jgi:hypothetical protein
MFDNTTANAVPSINSSNNGFVDSGMIYNSATTSLGIGVASANDIEARLHIVGTGTANTGETMFKVNNSNDHDRIEFIDEGISSGMPSALRNIGASLGLGIISENGAVKLFSGGHTTSDLVLEASDTGIQFSGAYRFPTTDGSANQFLQTNGSGTLTFASLSGGTGVTYSSGTISIGQAVATTSNVRFNSIGVGTAASNSAGDIRATADVTAYYSSDARLKENIVEIDNALDKVKSIRGVTYDWKDEYIESKGGADDYFMRKNDVGVIAQEIEAVLPEIVAERDDGIKAVRYERLTALLIEAVKELSARVDELEKKQ